MNTVYLVHVPGTVSSSFLIFASSCLIMLLLTSSAKKEKFFVEMCIISGLYNKWSPGQNIFTLYINLLHPIIKLGDFLYILILFFKENV